MCKIKKEGIIHMPGKTSKPFAITKRKKVPDPEEEKTEFKSVKRGLKGTSPPYFAGKGVKILGRVLRDTKGKRKTLKIRKRIKVVKDW